MTNFNKYQKWAMIALPLSIVLNPLFIVIYIDYVTMVLEGLGVVCVGYLIGFMLWAVLRPQPVVLPTKDQKTESIGKFIVTKRSK